MPVQIIVSPHPRLAPWIGHILVTHFENGGVSHAPASLSPRIVVFARGAGRVFDHLANCHPRMGCAVLLGPCLNSTITCMEEGTRTITVIFRPGVIADILGPGGDEIREQIISLDCVLAPGAVQLMLERIFEESNPLVWVQHVQQLLLENLREQENPYDLQCNLQNITRLFQPAKQTAAELGVGVRQLERHIARAYGANLRDLRRMVRFRFSVTKILYDVRQRGDLTRIAHSCGYYDHSHMDRDFVSLVGCSPTQLLQSLSDQDPRFWMYNFVQRDFEKLFVQTLFAPTDAASVQEIIFGQK